MPTKTNETTAAVIAYIHYNGGAAWRINIAPIPIRKGNKVVAFRKSLMKGMADVRAIYKGLSLDIEIKTGKDTQKPEQWAFQQEVERAGGVYFLVKDSTDFATQFEEFKYKVNNC